MSLQNLIRNLDSAEKTQLLGAETTRILRFTFVLHDTDQVDGNLIDQALSLLKGVDFVNNRRLRLLLLESIPSAVIRSLGIENHEAAIAMYSSDVEKFILDFNIEDEYRHQPLIENRLPVEICAPKHGEKASLNGFPHPYQLSLKLLLFQQIRHQYHNDSILVSMPTGSGKTVLAMELILDLIRTSAIDDAPIEICWLVDSKELCEQSLNSFQKLWKQKGDRPVTCQRYFGAFDNLDHSKVTKNPKITFAAFTLLTPRLAQRNPQVISLLENTTHLFIDEAHGANAITYNSVLHAYRDLRRQPSIIGLTATPFRNDDVPHMNLQDLFTRKFTINDEDGKTVESPIQFLMNNGYLANLQFEILNSERGTDSSSDYYRNLHTQVLSQCKNIINREENTIIFAESKSHAIALHLYLKQHGIENELIVGETLDAKRKDILNRFGDDHKSLSIIVNHQILATGIDVPGMNSIMILSRINSPSLALQVLGRAMRGEKNGGNLKNTIFLTKDNEVTLTDFNILEQRVLNPS